MDRITKTRTTSKQRRGAALLGSLLLVLTGWSVWIDRAEAIPAFARKYNVSCNVCHTRQPRLNPFGQRFQENGYQMPQTEGGGTTEKSLFGGPLDGATIDDISNYMAVRLRSEVQKAKFREDTEATDKADIVFPGTINVFFAGTATKNISFFLEGEFATQGEEEAGLGFERAFLIFDNLGGHQVANFKIGQFDPSSFFSFPTHRQQLNPIPPDAEANTFPPTINRIPLLPLAFTSKMYGLTTGPGSVGASTGTFNPMAAGPIPTYANQGGEGFAILPFQPFLFNVPASKGLTVYGRPCGPSFLYQAGFVQADTAEDEPETRFDPYLMLRYDVLAGDYSAFQVSGFYYKADKAVRATLAPPPLAGGIIFSQNALNWKRYGLGARWHYKYFDVYGAVIHDKIDDPIFGNPVVDTGVWETKASGLSLEGDWLVTSDR